MITFYKKTFIQDTTNQAGKRIRKELVEGHCKSGDTKPTAGIANGSTLIEMDTSKLYFFDEASKVWREF